LVDLERLVRGVLEGDRRSIARAITIAEDRLPEAEALISALRPHSGRAHIIGVTGPGGSGKSTLIHQLVKKFREMGLSVGVVAVDPTSPFTGGAFLGDRVRMQELAMDPQVFIRSMATRGSLGGVAEATRDAALILDASGKDIIIVETVGAGQLDVEVARVAETILLVMAPGLGDEIQAIKAGLMEIADIFVVNKADRENAEKTVSDLLSIIDVSPSRDWTPPIVKTVATTGEGIDELVDAIIRHGKYVEEEKRERGRMEVEAQLIDAIRRELTSYALRLIINSPEYKDILSRVQKGELTPEEAAATLVKDKLKETLRRQSHA